jgi:hypothetical protein
VRSWIQTFSIVSATLSATLLSACFSEGMNNNPQAPGQSAKLVIGMGVKDVGSLGKQGLAKGHAITLSKLVVTLTSNVSTDSVIRDTVLAGTPGFSSASGSQQTVFRNYNIKPLRNWIVEVKTLDLKDSVIHRGVDTAKGVTVGESRVVTLNLTSRFVVYAAKFLLPDSIGSSDTNVTGRQKLDVNRIVMVVDGDTVMDSTTAANTYFPSAPTPALLEYNYIPVDKDTTSVELYVYSDNLGNWDPNLPIFGDTIKVSDLDSIYKPTLPWTGPGSSHDPAGPGGGSTAEVNIVIGPVDVVFLEPVVPLNPLSKQLFKRTRD